MLRRAVAALALAFEVVVWVGTGPAYGYEKAQLDRLIATGECRRCDLSAANLKGLFLAKAKLEEANLSDANLDGAQLSKAQLGKANLAGASLKGAFLGGADLTLADLSDSDLSRTQFYNAKLLGTKLTGAQVYHTEFDLADLGDAFWIDGTLCRKEGSIGQCNH
ncbi:MAG: hypothetical protein A2426_08530 [Candidatus Lambdaproteobacteria bacterium RIFOXYC1_FULL_56_13]|nr:MAG: hypothetical protein A2426_08530 [Candidatus Lambdaproteobacteria bacterium RIFOXYC1_FULL_56_13]